MVPPGDIGPVPIWIVVYLGLLIAGAIASYVLYRRVVWLVLQGRSAPRFDRPFERLRGAALIVLGQRRVLQRVPQRDWAGIGHALIFWGFLSFTLSYVIFIFGASIWSHFPEWLLTPLGVRSIAPTSTYWPRCFWFCWPGRFSAVGGAAAPPQLRSYPQPGLGDHRCHDRRADGVYPSDPRVSRG